MLNRGLSSMMLHVNHNYYVAHVRTYSCMSHSKYYILCMTAMHDSKKLKL